MEKSSNSLWSVDRWPAVLSMCALVATAISFIGLECYWSSFDIDFTVYMDLSEFLKRSIPTIVAAFFLAAYFLFSDDIHFDKTKIDTRGIVIFLIIGVACAVTWIMAVDGDADNSTIIFRAAFTGTLITMIAYCLDFNKTINNVQNRRRVWILLFPILALSIYIGITLAEAAKVRKGITCNEVKAIDLDEDAGEEKLLRLKYIGTIGEKIFLCGKDNHKVTIVSYENIVSITLGRRTSQALK